MISKWIALPHQYISSVAIDDCQASQMLKQVGLPLSWQILKNVALVICCVQLFYILIITSFVCQRCVLLQ